MNIHFLGTAAAEGWPAVFCQCQACKKARIKGGKNIRTRSSVLINNRYLVDFPPDTFVRAIRDGIDLGQIEHILITHSHHDHFYPEDLLMRTKPYAHFLAKELKIWGNKVVIDKISDNKIDTISATRVYPNQKFQAGELEVLPLRANHTKQEEALLFIIRQDDKKVFYAHDSDWFLEETWEQLYDSQLDCVIFDCTYGPLDGGGHMGIPKILKAKEKLFDIGAINKNSVLVITHFSHNGGYLHDELEKLVKDDGLIVAYDGMLLEI